MTNSEENLGRETREMCKRERVKVVREECESMRERERGKSLSLSVTQNAKNKNKFQDNQKGKKKKEKKKSDNYINGTGLDSLR